MLFVCGILFIFVVILWLLNKGGDSEVGQDIEVNDSYQVEISENGETAHLNIISTWKGSNGWYSCRLGKYRGHGEGFQGNTFRTEPKGPFDTEEEAIECQKI